MLSTRPLRRCRTHAVPIAAQAVTGTVRKGRLCFWCGQCLRTWPGTVCYRLSTRYGIARRDAGRHLYQRRSPHNICRIFPNLACENCKTRRRDEELASRARSGLWTERPYFSWRCMARRRSGFQLVRGADRCCAGCQVLDVQQGHGPVRRKLPNRRSRCSRHGRRAGSGRIAVVRCRGLEGRRIDLLAFPRAVCKNGAVRVALRTFLAAAGR
jgi:hypothetical protein